MKLMFWMLPAFILAQQVMGQEVRWVQPLDFQDDAIPETFAQAIHQLESNGRSIFVRTENAHVLEIDRTGNVVGLHFLPQEGPSHKLNVGALSLYQDQLALVNQNHQTYVLKNQQTVASFRSNLFTLEDFYTLGTTQSFAFDGKHLVLPSQQESKIAVVLDGKGNLMKRLGKPIDFPDDLKWDPKFLNATFWANHGGKWYCLYKFKPLLVVYDAQFRVEREIHFFSEAIAEAELAFYEPDAAYRGTMHIPVPHFSDFKIVEGKAFLLCRGALLKLDLESGEIGQTYHFFGKGEDFAQVPKGQRLNMMFFAHLANNVVVLSHPAMLWNHDLWVAKL